MDLAKVIHYQLAYNVYSLWHVSHTTLSSLVNAIQVKIYFEVLMHFFAFFIHNHRLRRRETLFLPPFHLVDKQLCLGLWSLACQEEGQANLECSALDLR
jgi:hypothetical protein